MERMTENFARRWSCCWGFFFWGFEREKWKFQGWWRKMPSNYYFFRKSVVKRAQQVNERVRRRQEKCQNDFLHFPSSCSLVVFEVWSSSLFSLFGIPSFSRLNPPIIQARSRDLTTDERTKMMMIFFFFVKKQHDCLSSQLFFSFFFGVLVNVESNHAPAPSRCLRSLNCCDEHFFFAAFRWSMTKSHWAHLQAKSSACLLPTWKIKLFL